MNFLNWFNLSPKLKRPANPALDTFACFDITPSELTQADLINENALIRLQSHFQYGAFCYELLYKRTLSTSIQYFSVFRSDRKTAAQALATRLHEVLSPLAEEINVKCFAADASVTLHEIILMAHTYSAWTCAHIAAHAGMSGVFKSPNAQIISNLSTHYSKSICNLLISAVFHERRTSQAIASYTGHAGHAIG